jgi:hypothetical protein
MQIYNSISLIFNYKDYTTTIKLKELEVAKLRGGAVFEHKLHCSTKIWKMVSGSDTIF